MDDKGMATPTIPNESPKLVNGRAIQGDNYSEVLFPRFTYQKPWQMEANFFSKGQQTTDIPIFRLSHITHKSEAKDIQSMVLWNGSFNFQPHMKVGKAYEYDGSPVGQTFREIGDDQYEEIPRSRDRPVFPGLLCWWGVHVHESELKVWDPLKDFCLNPTTLENGQYSPGYLTYPAASSYGNIGFSITLKDIVSDYKQSRDDQHGKEVCLKVGGTLRYRNEICYVVMVCMEEDDMWDMPSITGPVGPFNPNGLVNDHGVVVDYNAVPTVTLQSIVRQVLNRPVVLNNLTYTFYDWEQLVFSFYFTNSDQKMTCHNIQMYDVQHDPPTCTSSIPTPEGMVCPNKLNMPKVVQL